MKFKIIISVVVAVTILGFGIWIKNTTPKIAYVKSLYLIENYKAMIEARALYENKHKDWAMQIDTLKKAIENENILYESMKTVMSSADKVKKEAYLNVLKKQYYDKAKKINDEATAEDDRMTQGVLTRVNEFIERYGKENHYTIIFSTMTEGNVLYGDSKIDITDDVLKKLNEEYVAQ